MNFEQEIKEAEKRVAELDDSDGWRNREPETIYQALLCGLRKPETGAAFDALVMLKDVMEIQEKAAATKNN